MNILNDFLNKFDPEELINVPRRDLVVFTMSLLKEVAILERENTGSPGKAAIEFLLNQKYEIVENRNIPRHIQDLLLKEVDSVINKVVVKYKVQRKGKNFYFDEAMSIVITAPDRVCDTEDQLIANIYAAQAELESLRVQLTRTNLQNTAQTLLIKKAVLDKEEEIDFMKKKLSTFRKFDSVTDQNLLYRRSLGEAQKETATGASLGAVTGYIAGSNTLKKRANFDKKRTDFQNASKALNKEKRNIQGLASEAKHLYNSGLTPNKSKKFQKIVNTMKTSLDNQRNLKKYVDSNGKKVLSITRQAIKKGLKSGAKGAAIGAAAGLGVAAAHKALNKNEALSDKLFSHLNKLNRIPITEDSDDLRTSFRIGKNLSKFKGTLTSLRRNKGVKAASIAGALLLGAAGISFIIKRAHEKGLDKVKGSIRSTQYKARNSKTLTNSEKMTIQNNGNAAIRKLDQMFKTNKRR